MDFVDALQGKYGDYRGISGISSRRKNSSRDFLLVIHEGWIISFRRDVHFRISLSVKRRSALYAGYLLISCNTFRFRTYKGQKTKTKGVIEDDERR